MKYLLLISFALQSVMCFSQKKHSLDVIIEISEDLKSLVNKKGRLIVRLKSEESSSSSQGPFLNGRYNFIATSIDGLPIDSDLDLSSLKGWVSNYEWDLGNVPEGFYEISVVWDQDLHQSGYKNPGNLTNSKPIQLKIYQPTKIKVKLDSIVASPKIVEHPLVHQVRMISDTLTSWWGNKVEILASVLTPSGFDNSKEYAIRYNVAGYGGRYNRVNSLVEDSVFMNWWTSEEAPQVVNVFLDGYGPFGDCYQLDSENSGPYGYALIHELIPFIESKFRGTTSAKTRFVDGCSTGGWVSLALQLFYPEVFNGCFSYSPDPVDFERFQLTNIYKDKNAFINEFNYERPMRRNVLGEPMWSMREYINYENTISPANSYIQSGGQFGAFNALFSPKGENDLPAPLFDAKTGEIDSLIAIHWSKYDLLKYTKENWEELGSKIHGKIFISMGDMDDFYLNFATHSFDEYLKSADNPKSDAKIEFLPTVGHCRQFSHKKALEQIKEKLINLKKGD